MEQGTHLGLTSKANFQAARWPMPESALPCCEAVRLGG